MSSSKFEKIVRILLVVLMTVSAGITVWGYAVGFNDASVNTLFYWAYVLMIVGIAAALLFGIAISAINNPKNLIKIGIELVAVVVVVGAVYMLSSGAPAQGYIAGLFSVRLPGARLSAIPPGTPSPAIARRPGPYPPSDRWR